MHHLTDAHYMTGAAGVLTQDDFFCRLAGSVTPTGIANVNWVGCINVIKISFEHHAI